MDRRNFFTRLFNFLSVSFVPVSFKNLFASTNNNAPLPAKIFLIKGATGSKATGIPRLADYINNELIVCGISKGPHKIKTEDWFSPGTYFYSNYAGWESYLDVEVIEYNETDKIKRWVDSIGTHSSQKRGHNITVNKLYIIGHSLGGNSAYNICTKIAPFVVDGLFLIDAVLHHNKPALITETPPNVKKGFNYYTRNGALWLIRGKHLGKSMENLNSTYDICRTDGCPLGIGHGFTHTNIDDCSKIHELVFNEIQRKF